MRNRTLINAALLAIFLGIATAGCGSPGTRDSDPTAVPKKDWGILRGNVRWEKDSKTFYNLFYVRSVNGEKLDSATENERIDCVQWNCRLRPGSHSIDIEYNWSTTQSRAERNAKGSLQALASMFVLFSGQVYIPPANEDNPCKTTMTFTAQPRREYAINIVHTVQREKPEEFQIIDMESGEVVSSTTPTCQIYYEVPVAFSNSAAPTDQCAMHLIMGKDHRIEQITFSLNGSHPSYTRHDKGYSYLLEPGEQRIEVSVPYNAAISNKRNTESIVINCASGESKYVKLDVEGFWTSRPTVAELSSRELARLRSN